MTDQKKLDYNAQIIIQTACHVKPGETLLIITEEKNKPPYNEPLAPIVDALTHACCNMGAHPVIMDIGDFVHSPAFDQGVVLKPVAAAMQAADVVLNAVDYVHYSRLLGESSNDAGAWQSDKYIQGEQRFYALQSSQIDKWNITHEKIAAIGLRTDWLLNLVRNAKTLHISSPAGTDFTVGYEHDFMAAPFRTLVPNFGEVATIPRAGSEQGRLVVDGPTQKNVRPANECDRQPLIINVKDGHVIDYSGDDQQVARLKSFIEDATPHAINIDEVGLLTTQVKENDLYWWEDGTHHTDRVHVALGNNDDRMNRVHGIAHMDCEVIKPTITIDGLVVVKDGTFIDKNVPGITTS